MKNKEAVYQFMSRILYQSFGCVDSKLIVTDLVISYTRTSGQYRDTTVFKQIKICFHRINIFILSSFMRIDLLLFTKS